MKKIPSAKIERTDALSEEGSWFLAQIRPNQVERARRNLERQGYRCFLPRRSVTLRRSGRLVQTLVPFFPGYLFVAIASAQHWHPVNATHGVSRLIMRAPDRPQPVPDPVMADLLANTDEAGVLLSSSDLAPGDTVRITGGPMSGFTARIVAADSPGRVGLLLEMMGRAVRAEVPPNHLQRLSG